jgi:hypothetical protein
MTSRCAAEYRPSTAPLRMWIPAGVLGGCSCDGRTSGLYTDRWLWRVCTRAGAAPPAWLFGFLNLSMVVRVQQSGRQVVFQSLRAPRRTTVDRFARRAPVPVTLAVPLTRVVPPAVARSRSPARVSWPVFRALGELLARTPERFGRSASARSREKSRTEQR